MKSINFAATRGWNHVMIVCAGIEKASSLRCVEMIRCVSPRIFNDAEPLAISFGDLKQGPRSRGDGAS
jgi:hypothetical protein